MSFRGSRREVRWGSAGERTGFHHNLDRSPVDRLLEAYPLISLLSHLLSIPLKMPHNDSPDQLILSYRNPQAPVS